MTMSSTTVNGTTLNYTETNCVSVKSSVMQISIIRQMYAHNELLQICSSSLFHYTLCYSKGIEPRLGPVPIAFNTGFIIHI